MARPLPIQFPGAFYHITARGNAKGNLSQGIRQLNGIYTQHFNKKYQRVGHLSQRRFKSNLVKKENYLLELSSYISLNPPKGQHSRRSQRLALEFLFAIYRHG